MCNYQGHEFGASYPDSVCIDGKLFDADNCDNDGNLYDTGEDIPCPMCDEAGAIEYWTERNRIGGGSRKAANKAARSLVADIRSNRGVPSNAPGEGLDASAACGQSSREAATSTGLLAGTTGGKD